MFYYIVHAPDGLGGFEKTVFLDKALAERYVSSLYDARLEEVPLVEAAIQAILSGGPYEYAVDVRCEKADGKLRASASIEKKLVSGSYPMKERRVTHARPIIGSIDELRVRRVLQKDPGFGNEDALRRLEAFALELFEKASSMQESQTPDEQTSFWWLKKFEFPDSAFRKLESKRRIRA